MTELKSLHDYHWTDFPDLINCILMDQVKLFALINADEATYFIPEEDPEAIRGVISGRYGICGINRVISHLEQIYKIESDPEQVIRPGPHKIPLRRFISPHGELGVVGRGFDPAPHDPFQLDPMFIPFSRILAEDNNAKSQIPSCDINTPEHKAMVAVHNEFWADGTGAPQDAIWTWIDQEFKHLKLGKVRTQYIERFCRPENRREGRRAK